MDPRKPLFLYDSDCGICTRLKRAVEFFDASHRVEFVPLADAALQGLLDGIPPSIRFSCSHMVGADGRVSSGGDAMVDLLSLLPAGRVPAALFRSAPFGMALARWTYGIASRLHGYSCGLGDAKGAEPSGMYAAWSST
ncbi:MAG: DUF393 domain-containing protein [Thaumarchaeota archaeon]|nr:DUF393 domain-containing protein [Nitrososphaerota archaeon]